MKILCYSPAANQLPVRQQIRFSFTPVCAKLAYWSMNRVLCRALVRSSTARGIFSAAQPLPAADFAAQVDVYPFAGNEAAPVDALKSNESRSPNCLRMSTAAVASRLTQQTQFPLLPGTPFTVEGALTVNPLQQPRLVITPGPNPTVLFANEEWEKISGFAPEELRGRNAMDVLTVNINAVCAV